MLISVQGFPPSLCGHGTLKRKRRNLVLKKLPLQDSRLTLLPLRKPTVPLLQAPLTSLNKPEWPFPWFPLLQTFPSSGEPVLPFLFPEPSTVRVFSKGLLSSS